MDFLSIKEKGRKIEKYCGTEFNSYTSTTYKVILKFKSNKKRNSIGFSCQYSLIILNGGSTSEIVSKAENAYSSGTCKSGQTGSCGCSTTDIKDSDYGEKVIGNIRLVATTGIPNHKFETDAENPNPNKACKHEVYMAVPKDPVKGSTYREYGMGPVGIALSGGFIYNHLASPQGDTAVDRERDSFDSCNGHSDPHCRYHYHMIPVCINNGKNCSNVGYMKDGFPVRSFCSHPNDSSRSLKSCYKLNGSGNGSHKNHYSFDKDDLDNGLCDLDEANGYDFSDGYAYVFTENYPFVMAGYFGTQAANICGI